MPEENQNQAPENGGAMPENKGGSNPEFGGQQQINDNSFLLPNQPSQPKAESHKNSFLEIVGNAIHKTEDSSALSEDEILGIAGGTPQNTVNTTTPQPARSESNHLKSVAQLFAPTSEDLLDQELSAELGQLEAQVELPISDGKTSRPNPVLHIAAALVIGLFLMGITFFLGGSATENNFIPYEDYLIPSGKTHVELLSREDFFARYQQAIFGGETITTYDGQARLHFSDGTVVRMNSNSVLKVTQIEPHPAIEVIEGDIWVFGQMNPEVQFKTAVFYPRAASGFFQVKDGVIKAASFRHPIFGKLITKSDRNATVIIPYRHQVTFSNLEIPDTFPDLHFSKLRKEMHLAETKDTDWALNNLNQDKKLLNDQLAEVRPRKKIGLEGSGYAAMIRDKMTLLPGKKIRNILEQKKLTRVAYLDEFVFRDHSYNLQVTDAPTPILNEALYYSNIISPDNSLIQNTEKLRDELDARQDIENKENIIAQNVLSLLEDALEQRSATVTEATLTSIVKKWQKEKYSDQNRIMLEMYREIITKLLRRNMSQITDSIFESAAKLDTIALQWETKDRVVTTLEIVEKNLETIDVFLKKSEFDIAQKILRTNDILLKLQPTPRLIETQLYLSKKQEQLKLKRSIFQSEGVMTDARFQEVLQKRKEAEQTIRDIRKSETALLNNDELVTQSNNPDSQEEYEEKLLNQIREDFSNQGLVLIAAPDALNNKSEIVRIKEALLPDGTLFGAEYFPESKVIRNIEIPSDGIVIESEILLNNLVIGVESMRAGKFGANTDLAKVTKQMEETWMITEEDPLEKVDPLIIDVSKRMVYSILQENQMKSSLKEITMLSEDTLRIKTAEFPEIADRTITFIYNIQNKTVSEAVMRPDGVALEAQGIADLKQQAIEMYNNIQLIEEQKNNVHWSLTTAGVKIKKDDITLSSSGVYFENGIFNDTWQISGLANPETKTFIHIKRNGATFLQGIEYQALKYTLQKSWDNAEQK